MNVLRVWWACQYSQRLISIDTYVSELLDDLEDEMCAGLQYED